MTESVERRIADQLYEALLPLCDDLPGEPPAILAWSPRALADRLAAQICGRSQETPSSEAVPDAR